MRAFISSSKKKMKSVSFFVLPLVALLTGLILFSGVPSSVADGEEATASCPDLDFAEVGFVTGKYSNEECECYYNKCKNEKQVGKSLGSWCLCIIQRIVSGL